MSQLLDCRFLPTRKQRLDGLPEPIILVETGGGQCEDTGDVRLRVHAPGLKNVAGLRQMLCHRLRQVLVGLHPKWVTDVIIDSEIAAEDDEVVVCVNAPNYLGEETIELVLSMVAGILRPLALAEGRPVYTLRGSQSLVLVDYSEYYTEAAHWIDLHLPGELELKGRLEDLERHIGDALVWRAPVWGFRLSRSDSLWVLRMTSAPDLCFHESEGRKLIEAAISAFAGRVTVEGERYNQLVFKPARQYVSMEKADSQRS